MGSEVLDHTLCQEMAKYVEELTTTGKPVLNPDIMKSFKKICRISSMYCDHAYHLLITQLEKRHAEIRLSAFLMIEELFNRSHSFRELLISNFQHFLELTVETNYDNPLPPPKTAADLLKSQAYSAIQKWYDKFGEEYKRLTLGFNFLKTCKKVDFNGIRARSETQQRQEREIEEKKKKIATERLEKTSQEMNELMEEIKNAITEAKSGFELVLPSPDDFFIDTAEDSRNQSEQTKNIDLKTCDSDIVLNSNIPNDEGQNECSKSSVKIENDSGLINDNEIKSSAVQENNSEDNTCTSIHSKNVPLNTTNSCVNDNFLPRQDCDNNSDSLGSSGNIPSCSNDSKSGSLSKIDVKNSNNTLSRQESICEELRKGDNSMTSKAEGSSEHLSKGKNMEDSYEGNITKHLNDVDVSCSNISNKMDNENAEIESDNESVEESEDEESEPEENVLQEHGLGNMKYNLSIDVTPGVVSLQETDDNKDILQTLKDQYRLIVSKYKPVVNKWLQTLSKYGDNEDTTKTVIDVKSELDGLLSKYHEMNIIPEEKISQEQDDSDDDFEDVPEKEGFEPVIPPHKRAEYGLDPLPQSVPPKPVTQNSKATTSERRTSGFWSLSKTIAQKPEDDPTTIRANLARFEQQPSSSGTKVDKPSKPKVLTTGDPEKDKLLKRAPVVAYGADLEHWENQDKMEAPLVVKYDSLHKFWAPHDFEELQTDQDGLAAMKNRSISFVGKFEPVKWKCRAPLPNGKFCERMDRFKCPFHGKIIARNDLGQPTDPKDIAALSSHDDININSNDQSYWRDPELEADIEAALGIDLGPGKGKSRGKGKGKGKGKQKKYPNLTDIKEVKNTSRNRLEKKVFKRSAMKRVAADMDALANKKAKDKFGNQFVYQMSQR